MFHSENGEKDKYPIWYLIPLIAVLAVIPLIVRYHNYNTGLTQYDWYQGKDSTTDFFLHTKMVWLLITAGVILLILAFIFFCTNQEIPWTKKLLPLALYGVLSIISTFTSINSSYSINGITEQFEPIWILLTYVLIVYYGYFILQSDKAVKRLMPWFVGGVVVMALLGLSQAFGHDFFRTDLGQTILYGKRKVAFSFEEGRSYLSLYNPNYVGYYVALVIPVIVALLLHAKKIWQKALYGVLILSLFAILFSSQSRAGIVALGLSILVMAVCMRKYIFKNWIIPVAGIAIILIAFIGINALNGNILLNRMKSMFTLEKETYALNSIVTNDDNVAITYNNITVCFSVTGDEKKPFKLTDKKGNTINYKKTDRAEYTEYAVDLADYPIQFGISESDTFAGFFVTINNRNWFFTNQMVEEDDTYYVRGMGYSLCKLKNHPANTKFFGERYHFANMRGYIWDQTLPLLKKYFWLGSGPDTFTIAFPNDDFVGLYNSGHDGEIISHPHCLYLQIAVQTGVPSLIAFLTFFGWYIISSFRIYWKQDYTDYMAKIGVGVLASVIGYLILGITNGSCIATAPIFFALTGLGLGINHYLSKKASAKEEVKEA